MAEQQVRLCGNCRWWLPDAPGPLTATGQCHGGPPTAVLMILPPEIAGGEIRRVLSSAWPPVGKNELPCAMHNFRTPPKTGE